MNTRMIPYCNSDSGILEKKQTIVVHDNIKTSTLQINDTLIKRNTPNIVAI